MVVLDLTDVSEKKEPGLCIIFDWDDTLCPSTFLENQDKSRGLLPEIQHQLATLERYVSHILSLAMEQGTVFIITNAQDGWVPTAMEMYMPNLKHWIDKLTVISARSRFESLYPQNPIAWKIRAFEETLSFYPSQHVLSFGDSMVDRSAIMEASRRKNIPVVKHIKLIEHPSIGQLCKEWQTLITIFPEIIKKEGSLDMTLIPD